MPPPIQRLRGKKTQNLSKMKEILWRHLRRFKILSILLMAGETIMKEEGLPCGEFGIDSEDQALDRDLKRVRIDFFSSNR